MSIKPNIAFFRSTQNDEFIQISISDDGIGLLDDKVFTVPVDDAYLSLKNSQIALAYLENNNSKCLVSYTINRDGTDEIIYDLYMHDRKTLCNNVINVLLENYLSGAPEVPPWKV